MGLKLTHSSVSDETTFIGLCKSYHKPQYVSFFLRTRDSNHHHRQKRKKYHNNMFCWSLES